MKLNCSQILIREKINIDEYPALDTYKAIQGSKISIGDLHGSALKMLYFLQRHGVIEMPMEEYLNFVKIYKIQKLTSKHLVSLQRIIASINVTESSKNSLVCFIGDDLCDRGTNDYFTLKILQVLALLGGQFEILISNHSVEFLSCYEKKTKFDDHIFFSGQGRSSDNLQSLIDSEMISRDEIVEIIENCYKPNLKVVSYSINKSNQENEMTLFSHAPIGINNLSHIATCFNISTDTLEMDSSNEFLSTLIDQINVKFSELLFGESGVYDLFKVRENLIDIMTGNFINPVEFPLAHVIWNRVHVDLLRPKNIFFVHGHDLTEIQLDNVCNLDNNLGKGIMLHKGEYTALYTHL